MRKVLLVGLTVLIDQQGSWTQLICGAVIATSTLAVFAWFSPYKLKTDNVLALLTQLVLLINLLLAMLLKGLQAEEFEAILRATDADNVTSAAAAARDEHQETEDAIGAALVLLCALPVPVAFVLLGVDVFLKPVLRPVVQARLAGARAKILAMKSRLPSPPAPPPGVQARLAGARTKILAMKSYSTG